MASKDMVISYMKLRTAIGALGLVLSALVALGQMSILKSISFYYWTSSRDVLVGVLVVAGALLMTYRGYDRVDRWLSAGAGIAAVGVALMPCYSVAGKVGYFQLSGRISNTFHVACAGMFFLLLAIMSYWRFAKGNEKKRLWGIKCNTIFRTCGIVMFALMGLLILLSLFFPFKVLNQYKVIFIIETGLLWAFGVSWLVKGYAIPKEVN
jgi:hypothetical protein